MEPFIANDPVFGPIYRHGTTSICMIWYLPFHLDIRVYYVTKDWSLNIDH